MDLNFNLPSSNGSSVQLSRREISSFYCNRESQIIFDQMLTQGEKAIIHEFQRRLNEQQAQQNPQKEGSSHRRQEAYPVMLQASSIGGITTYNQTPYGLTNEKVAPNEQSCSISAISSARGNEGRLSFRSHAEKVLSSNQSIQRSSGLVVPELSSSHNTMTLQASQHGIFDPSKLTSLQATLSPPKKQHVTYKDSTSNLVSNEDDIMTKCETQPDERRGERVVTYAELNPQSQTLEVHAPLQHNYQPLRSNVQQVYNEFFPHTNRSISKCSERCCSNKSNLEQQFVQSVTKKRQASLRGGYNQPQMRDVSNISKSKQIQQAYGSNVHNKKPAKSILKNNIKNRLSNIENIMKAYNSQSNINGTVATQEDYVKEIPRNPDLADLKQGREPSFNSQRQQQVTSPSHNKIVDIHYKNNETKVMFSKRDNSSKKRRPQSSGQPKCMALKGAQDNVERVLKLIRGHCPECKAYTKKIERII